MKYSSAINIQSTYVLSFSFSCLFNLFQCELIMEKHEPHITEVFKEEKPHEDAVIELCETRTKLCSGLKKKLAKDEL